MNVWTIFFGTLLAFTEYKLWMLDPFWRQRKDPTHVFFKSPTTYALVGMITRLILVPLFFLVGFTLGGIHPLAMICFMIVFPIAGGGFLCIYVGILFRGVLENHTSVDSLHLPDQDGKKLYVTYRIFSLASVGVLVLSVILAIF